MTTTLSKNQAFVRQATDSLRADQPMDSGYTWTLLDNISHLLDECGKYRVNWMSRNAPDDNFLEADQHYGQLRSGGDWYTIFPTQIVIDNQYPRYDVRVATIRGDEDVVMRVSLVTPGVRAPITSATQSGVIGTALFTLDVGSGPQVWLDALFPSASAKNAPFYTMQSPNYPGTEAFVGTICLVKLIVERVDYVVSEGNPLIIGVQVREYLR